MSSDPTPPLAAAPVENGQANAAEQAIPDAALATAPLKPLLNPLQSDSTPPASTIAEPPRSPNPQNPATDAVGNNMELDLPSASTSVVGAGEMPNGGEATESNTPLSAIPPAVSAQNGFDSPTAPISREDTAPPPLPTDAPVPPTPPQPKDEAPPTLPPGAIPPAVSTTTVITTESPAAPESTPAISAAPALPEIAQPAASVPESSVAPAPVTNGSDAMEIDPVEPPTLPGLESRGSEGNLKRAGEALEGREEKRAKEEIEASQTEQSAAPDAVEAPAPAPTSTIAMPVFDPNGPTPPWLSYVEPAAKPAGPTTPLTITQHKHLLSSVRAVKKSKEAVNFLSPVDVVLFGIPHYAQIITTPMDLGTVEQKLLVSDPRGPPKDRSKMSKWDTSKGSYSSVSEVVKDVRQIWENTRKFNGPDHVVSVAAKRLDEMFEKMLDKLPAEPIAAPPTPSPVAPSPAAGPSHPRRPSISQVPAARRSSDGPDSSRPKREIHPPPSKDLGYDGYARKPKRRNDPQIQWASRTIKSINDAQKNADTVAPFLYPVEQIIQALPAYADIIRNPIDLIQIRAKLDDGEYDDVSQVDADIRLMVRNAQTFNAREDPVHIAAGDYLTLWNEKWRGLPPKQEAREFSEDPLADDYIEDESDEEDARLLQKLESQITSLQSQITDIRARRTQRRSRYKKNKSKGPVRKQSMSKGSPGVGSNGNGPKKARKSGGYRDDEEVYSDDESGVITLSQKQELAEKIGQCDPDTLGKAIQIIQQTTDLGSNNEEIELDIDTLPARTITKLYNLVVRGGRKAPKNKTRPLKKTGRKATGGANRKFMNEDEEADRIRKMEAQLQSFDTGRSAAAGYGYDDGDDDSSEEESSDED